MCGPGFNFVRFFFSFHTLPGKYFTLRFVIRVMVSRGNLANILKQDKGRKKLNNSSRGRNHELGDRSWHHAVWAPSKKEEGEEDWSEGGEGVEGR